MVDDIINMPIIEKRRLVKSGASLVISLPRKWLEENGLIDGGEVIVRANGDLRLEVANPENIQKMNEQIEDVRKHINNQMTTKPANPNGT